MLNIAIGKIIIFIYLLMSWFFKFYQKKRNKSAVLKTWSDLYLIYDSSVFLNSFQNVGATIKKIKCFTCYPTLSMSYNNPRPCCNFTFHSVFLKCLVLKVLRVSSKTAVVRNLKLKIFVENPQKKRNGAQ